MFHENHNFTRWNSAVSSLNCVFCNWTTGYQLVTIVVSRETWPRTIGHITHACCQLAGIVVSRETWPWTIGQITHAWGQLAGTVVSRDIEPLTLEYSCQLFCNIFYLVMLIVYKHHAWLNVKFWDFNIKCNVHLQFIFLEPFFILSIINNTKY